MHDGFMRVAAASPQVSVADIGHNSRQIVAMARELSGQGAEVIVFPEMSVTAYTCADLFHNRAIIDGALGGLRHICSETMELESVLVVGAPIEVSETLYNCAVVIYGGHICAAVPKTYLPNYNEFYEKRWWASGPADTETIRIGDDEVAFGSRQLIEINGVKVGIEICEDLWVPVPPSCHLAMAGADVILNLSASDDVIGKYAYLNSLITQQSARCICGYAYASAGYGESSTDLVFDAKTIIAENGSVLARNERWQSTAQSVMADIDIEALRRDRMHLGSWHDCKERENQWRYHVVSLGSGCAEADAKEADVKEVQAPRLLRRVDPTPFVPPTDSAMAQRCDEIINIQVAGLAKRLEFIHCKSLVIGISGGLDSTLALLVAVRAFDRLGLDRRGIEGVTMPGFGTTGRTRNNALQLMEQLGVHIREIPIGPAVTQHFSDIGHDPEVHDVTYENCQARERTQILMDIANQTGGIVLGTGDLSELALGWATYNGDHMSMYGVNVGVPKTLVRYLVRHFADTMADAGCRATLHDIIDTPISPELIPADSEGNITQKTEDLVGPYELHDFYLYYTLRYGFSPRRIYRLALVAFEGRYTAEEIERWERTFVRRFFQQQFKRSCLPDGPKVGSVCLSPRGDWRMPSDASSTAFQL